jgi:hypothetical protein
MALFVIEHVGHTSSWWQSSPAHETVANVAGTRDLSRRLVVTDDHRQAFLLSR